MDPFRILVFWGDYRRYFKINGSSLFSFNLRDKQERELMLHILSENTYSIENCFQLWHAATTYRNFVLFHFAWEDEAVSRIKSVLESYNDATILVIIGYSFPYFNKRIDAKILASMPNLRTIYIQVASSDFTGSRRDSTQLFQGLKAMTIARLLRLMT